MEFIADIVFTGMMSVGIGFVLAEAGVLVMEKVQRQVPKKVNYSRPPEEFRAIGIR